MRRNNSIPEIIRIPFQEMKEIFLGLLIKHGLTDLKAETCAKVFAENSLDGVYTHGVNRVSRFIKYIKRGYININAEPEKVHSAGAIEQWDGNLGPGPLNALSCTDRAIQIAKEYGIGCVALANTNHWMRAGYYGWKAAKRGFVFIGWTNTIKNMPAWGAVDPRLGNNPLVLAVPFGSEAIVLDMAMSQFSYGSVESHEMKKQLLTVAGGYDKNGKLTTDPSQILESKRFLPMGYWKGAGLSLLLDILAAVLSGGWSTMQISKNNAEYGASQVFIAVDISLLNNYSSIADSVNEIIKDYSDSLPESEKQKVLYPGQRVLITRKENMELGIPVDKEIWEEVNSLM
jgi:3-dehydro-L-gulonate 2-dehydrogenase